MGDWIFDSVVGYMSSPLWNVPVATFVENNCVVFDTEDENKLEYTQIHAKYKEMIETLLENFLVDLGISPEQFAGVVDKAASGSGALKNEAVFASVIAAEDFQLFKSVMSKKNIELEMQVRALYQAQITNSESVERPSTESVPAEDDEEEAMMREALRLSLADVTPTPAADWDDAELAAAIEASRQESEALVAQSKAEAVHLQTAVKSSLKTVSKPKPAAAPAAPLPPAPKRGSQLPSLVPVPGASSGGGTSVSSVNAAAAWMSDAARESDAEVRARPKSALKKTNERDERKKYLQEQRVKLLEKRNAEREKSLSVYTAEQGGAPAPPAAVPGAVAAPAGSDADRAEYRKVLAARLKREVVQGRG